MGQLTIRSHDTPKRLAIEVTQDPYDEGDPVSIVARIYAVDGSVLAACAVQLRGLEVDCLDSVVNSAVTCYRWGAPQTQLSGMMRHEVRQARVHARKHER